jgi:sialic acid synthase SpsE
MNLRRIPTLVQCWRNSIVGLSDHTLSTVLPAVAVGLGASIIEKHLTLSRDDGGPDCRFSLEPDEFREMVANIRLAEAAMGTDLFGPTDGESASLRLRRSLWIVKDVKAGEAFTTDNVRSIRPADGLAPKHLDDVLGKVARVDVSRGTPLGWEMIE